MTKEEFKNLFKNYSFEEIVSAIRFLRDMDIQYYEKFLD